jgi:protein-S-isoprenylcysteine O-methyltransferase Ste14
MMDLRLIRRKFTSELTLIIFFLVISAYMFFVAWSFSSGASRFPILSSATVIILSIYLLVKFIYKEKYNNSRDSDLVQNIVSSTTNDIEIDKEIKSESTSDETSNHWALVFMMMIFVALSYLIGIFYSSLVFIAMYGLWQKRTWYETIAMVVLTYLIGMFFIIVLNVDLHTGIIALETII